MRRSFLAAVTAAFATMTMAAPAAAQGGDLSPRLSLGTFVPYSEQAAAVTYAPEQVPVGSRIQVVSIPIPGGHTKIVATVQGLEPDRDYGAHVHTRPCGPTGAAAGPHFQQIEAPEGHSGDPAFANPDNEVWLDFHTDASGSAVTTAFGDWDLRGVADSVVIHEHHTLRTHGSAGDAGKRLACLNARF